MTYITITLANMTTVPTVVIGQWSVRWWLEVHSCGTPIIMSMFRVIALFGCSFVMHVITGKCGRTIHLQEHSFICALICISLCASISENAHCKPIHYFINASIFGWPYALKIDCWQPSLLAQGSVIAAWKRYIVIYCSMPSFFLPEGTRPHTWIMRVKL